ncbi:hypothetical protein I302_100161 [Kwoniella bestiolae CBS 10118]|uniref:BHLH domain-containing protein n=1 Tax=Kwoniella bestiolae CBS 10118 TaxID=1296100 RepID=A0A1B9G4D5_9TREE|nr:hypothetical protein I302_03536 [Kwoniella bestiolae CBS 10118]OCF25862.1 hypothetical protein I302_03536 [Kwoniella bestiolae CBS 10118]
MTTIKTEGFKIPGLENNNNRPSMHRPFSDGSMTVETNLLTSLMSGSPHQMPMNMVSPFSFSSSLPAQTHTFDYSMNSPLSSSADRFHPAAMFSAMKFGNDNPEPPINLANNEDPNQRSRSQSSSRSSHVGKAPSSRSRSARKSMNDARPPPGSIQPRGRSTQPGRAQSFSGPAQVRASSQSGNGKPMGLGIGLDTHVEGEQTDSISPPDFGLNGSFGMSIPRTETDTISWGSGSVPSMLPGSLGSFGETMDDAIIDSPMTPAKPLPHQLTDESYKKQRRRECHNQVEKRRREHINAKIEELCHLLPPFYNLPDNEEAILDEEEEEEGKPHIESGKKKKKTKRAASMNSKAMKDAVQCKGRILSHSVQYIRDLKHVTDVQAGRIAHLEAMLMTYGVNPAIQPPPIANNQSSLFWMGDNNSNPNPLNQQPTFDLSGAHSLEVMRPSPEPDRPFSFEHMNLDTRTWGNTMTNGNGHTHDTAHDVLMTFEPSPNTASTSSINNVRRSSESVSSSASFDRENTEALDMHSPLSMNMSISDMRGRQRERTVRKDSQAELQMSMSALLSGVGAGGRDESDGGMRW